jgi:GntR family transcriptional regulator
MQWNNNQPIYQQVRDHVVSLIIDGVLTSGDPIPSVRQMAVEGGVNPLTVSKAYQELVDLKIVEKRRGLGMFIIESSKKQLVKLERDKFLKGDWPAIVRKADQLDIDIIELVQKRKKSG